MSSTPAPEPRPEPSQGVGQTPRDSRKPALVFDDPLSRQSEDDTDGGWGERPSGDSAGDLARFLDEKPPHHL
ncbi:hypothetical protein [Streptomyces ureilyticus]|uniref:Uncharacterized protein n=1 Tax=Streptomyces ureilyticus TaxID=1775131 RepID=A0ABX0DLK9_9ACTN|nr:hypothetical protein [Streptomyces ureilyticus]NGO41198.1 hypothetical protein [Streptomyces ureilyticus]